MLKTVLLGKFTTLTNDDLLRLIGGVLAIVFGLFVYKAQKRVLNWNIRNRLICEFNEIHRHLQRNLEVLETMKKNKESDKKVSVMRVEKLRITINQTFTDDELLRNMSKECTYVVFPLCV